ncbi:MAG: ribonuclease Z, partial [Eudoraea sp.]
AFSPKIVPLLSKVDVLYHEATFLEEEAVLAQKTKHSTAKQAATIASKAKVGLLILGHFSTRYKTFQPFVKQASEIFESVVLAEDGLILDL